MVLACTCCQQLMSCTPALMFAGDLELSFTASRVLLPLKLVLEADDIGTCSLNAVFHQARLSSMEDTDTSILLLTCTLVCRHFGMAPPASWLDNTVVGALSLHLEAGHVTGPGLLTCSRLYAHSCCL